MEARSTITKWSVILAVVLWGTIIELDRVQLSAQQDRALDRKVDDSQRGNELEKIVMEYLALSRNREITKLASLFGHTPSYYLWYLRSKPFSETSGQSPNPIPNVQRATGNPSREASIETKFNRSYVLTYFSAHVYENKIIVREVQGEWIKNEFGRIRILFGTEAGKSYTVPYDFYFVLDSSGVWRIFKLSVADGKETFPL